MSSRFRRRRPSRAAVCVVGGAAVVTLSALVTAPGALAKPCYGDCTPGVVRVGAGVLRYDAPVGFNDQITVTADGGAEDGPVRARDTIAADVENLEGSIRDDVLTGNSGANVINGDGGHDTVQGLGGGDQLSARGGGTVDGGAGTDQCTSDLRGL